MGQSLNNYDYVFCVRRNVPMAKELLHSIGYIVSVNQVTVEVYILKLNEVRVFFENEIIKINKEKIAFLQVLFG